jgi:hypothetical protein
MMRQAGLKPRARPAMEIKNYRPFRIPVFIPRQNPSGWDFPSPGMAHGRGMPEIPGQFERIIHHKILRTMHASIKRAFSEPSRLARDSMRD